jgi:folate-dependent tRNA-U54 methylase TrmFO/GidA
MPVFLKPVCLEVRRSAGLMRFHLVSAPVGLTDREQGDGPYAVFHLRRENASADSYNMDDFRQID